MKIEETFAYALQFTLQMEGLTFEDNPNDPGGPTKMGITDSEYQVWREKHHLAHKFIRDMESVEAREIYRQMYWAASHCPELAAISPAIAVMVFDTSVNLGPGRGTRWLQAAVGATQDGAIGPVTLAAVRATDPAKVVKAMTLRRLQFRDERVKAEPSQKEFLKGWRNRDNALLRAAIEAGWKP